MNQTNLALKKLNGIKPKGVKVNSSSAFKQIFELGENIIEKLGFDFRYNLAKDTNLDMFCYKRFMDYLVDINAHKINFTENDLTTFIHARSTRDYSDVESGLMGLYSGWLLSTLTRKNKKQNKSTLFYIDGQGMKFDYLFYNANCIDWLIVDNFKGNHLCNMIGREKGSVNLAAIINCESTKSLGSFFCSNKGIANTFIIANCNAEAICGSIANDGGVVDKTILLNCNANEVGACDFRSTKQINLSIECDIERDYSVQGFLGKKSYADEFYIKNKSKQSFPQLDLYAKLLAKSNDEKRKLHIIKAMYKLRG
ncbi:hypothetical protein HOK51_07810 [Candidatus Woesearchaeota archaeon]|jgi:hypothetical protein|nr:hypothetical protein [Candidatus Woesearchaeota archaeon]MBT6519730.1 hypothetical protein [Candidatus Woesearchaeota archaeon]MBT7368110.1 hypothetical protein [Candidatus Woesearchaeota archaeon]